MRAHDRAVDHRILVVGIPSQALEHTLPHVGLGPAAEPAMHRHPVAKALGQVAPGQARTEAVKHSIDKQAVVLGCHPNMARPARKTVPYALPLVVAKAITPHQSTPLWLTRYEPHRPQGGKPLNDDTL